MRLGVSPVTGKTLESQGLLTQLQLCQCPNYEGVHTKHSKVLIDTLIAGI